MLASTIVVLIFLLLTLAFFVGTILLQVFLSKKEGKWLGLILPAISFSFSLLAILGSIFYSTYSKVSLSANDNVIALANAEQLFPFPAIATTAIYMFIIFNIPTAVFVIIYAVCKNNRSKRKDLDKMSIQDLQ